MPPSSLIFLVVIAIWAAYLLQHWLKRRDHLATARSVDRFSEAMRVLDRSKSLAETNLGEAPVRSYAVTPARHQRPQVLVKRAEPLVATGSASLAAAGSGLAAVASSARTLAARMSAAAPVGVTERFRREPGGGSGLDGTGTRGGADAAYDRGIAARPAPAEPLGSGRAVRTVLFVASIVAVVLAGLGAYVGLVGVKIMTLTLVALIGSFVYLRRAVAREKAAQARARRDQAVMERRSVLPTGRPAPRRPSPTATRPSGTPDVTRRAAGRSAVGSSAGHTEQVQAADGRPAAAAAGRVNAVFDGATFDAPAPVRASEPAPTPAAGSWEPVPVPRPTYTMKAKAVHPSPVLDDVVDEFDDVVDPYAASRDARGRRASG